MNLSTGVVTGQLNVTDPDGDSLTYSVTQPASGTVLVSANGTYTFTPNAAARSTAATTPGPDSVTFTVTATDGRSAAVSVPVTAPITPSDPGVNQPPVAGTPSTPSVNPVTGVVTGQLNFTDPNGDPLTYAVTQPSVGTVAISATGTYTFTPTQTARDAAAAGTGPTSVTLTVTATDNRSAPVPVQLTVPISPTPRPINTGGHWQDGQYSRSEHRGGDWCGERDRRQ